MECDLDSLAAELCKRMSPHTVALIREMVSERFGKPQHPTQYAALVNFHGGVVKRLEVHRTLPQEYRLPVPSKPSIITSGDIAEPHFQERVFRLAGKAGDGVAVYTEI